MRHASFVGALICVTPACHDWHMQRGQGALLPGSATVLQAPAPMQGAEQLHACTVTDGIWEGCSQRNISTI